MSTDIDDPRYRIEGTRLTNATAWMRDNFQQGPPKFWHRHRVEFVTAHERDFQEPQDPQDGDTGTVVDVYPDCDLTPLYKVEWDSGKTSTGIGEHNLKPSR